MPNSSVKDKWAPMGGRDALAKTGVAETFNFNFCNDPLVPVRQYVNILHGLDHKRMGGDPARRRLPPLQHRRSHPAG